MAGVSEMPSGLGDSHDHGHNHSRNHNDKCSYDDERLNQDRRESLADFLARSALTKKLRHVHIVTDDDDFTASFGQPEQSSKAPMYPTVGSFMRNNPMAQSQFNQDSFGGGQPYDASQPFGTQSSQSRPGWPGVSQNSQPPPARPHFHAFAPQGQQPPAGFTSAQGSFGQPGFSQFSSQQSGPPQMPPQPQMPQPPQYPFSSQQTQSSFGPQPGQFGTNTSGASCCPVGSGFCGQQNPSQGPPRPGAPGAGGYAFAPGFYTNSMSGQASSGTAPSGSSVPQGWGQAPPAPHGWATGSIPPSNLNPDPERESMRDFCSRNGITRSTVLAALHSGMHLSGNPNCGCDNCRFNSALGTAASHAELRPDLLSAIHRSMPHEKFGTAY